MAQTPTEWVAANVRAELARQRKSARSTALALGWSPSRMARRMSGNQPFTVAELAVLAAHLDVPVSTFMPDTVGAA